MGKLAFFLIIAVLVYWIIKARLSEKTNEAEDSQTEDEQTDDDNNGTPKSLEDMVRCAHCGVHLPRSESITSQGKFFCCDEHRQKHLEKTPS